MDILGAVDSTLIGITVLTVLLTYILLASMRPKNFPTGPPVLPIVGSLPFWTTKADEYMNDILKMHQKYGDIFSVKMGRIWVLIVKDYEMLKELYEERGQDFSGRPFEDLHSRFEIMHHDKNFGILFADNNGSWKNQRETSETILNNLGRNRLQEIITHEAEELCKIITNTGEEILDIYELLSVSTAKVIHSLMFGETNHCQNKEFDDLTKCMDDAFHMMNQDFEVDWIPYLKHLPLYKKKLGQLSEIYNHLHAVLDKKIQEVRTSNDKAEPKNFIGGYLKMLNESKHLNDRSVQITQDFFQAGTETVTSTLSWTFYYMLKHPETQNKVQEELDNVVGQSRDVTLQDRANLPYTEASLAEILRLACTSPITIDHKALIDSKIAGYRIPKGTVIWGNLWAILRNPEVFPEPEEFRPERFIQEDGTFKRHEHLINFSIGPRSCLGESMARQELFLFFTRILQKFKLTVPEGHTHPPPKGIFAFTHRPPVYKLVAKCRT